MLENWLVNTCEPEPETVCYCEICGSNIREGDEYYNVGGTIICEDCIRDFKKVATIE